MSIPSPLPNQPQSIVPIAPQGKAPDALGLAAAQAAQNAVAPHTVILFGSRARGDHRPDSDVDLLVICDGNNLHVGGRARRAVKSHFKTHPPQLGLDIVTIGREKFHYARRAKNHVAGQALRDGVIMSGESFGYNHSYDDGYPESWPDVKERMLAAYRHLRTFDREISHPEGEQENYGFHAQQAIENALKAWLSAANLEYRRIHDIQEIAEKIFNDPVESEMLAAAQLQLLLDYTNFDSRDYPGEIENWLTRYAAYYRYSGTAFRMDGLEKSRFRQEIIIAAETFINRAHELSGTSNADLS